MWQGDRKGISEESSLTRMREQEQEGVELTFLNRLNNQTIPLSFFHSIQEGLKRIDDLKRMEWKEGTKEHCRLFQQHVSFFCPIVFLLFKQIFDHQLAQMR